MTCVHCSNWTLRGAGLARHAFGNCKFGAPGEVRGATAPICERFEATTDHEIERRKRWMAGNRIRVTETTQ